MARLTLLWIFSLCFSCTDIDDLKGHWHVYPDGDSYLIIRDYEVLEIRKDSSATFGHYFYGNYGLGGGIINNIFEQKLVFGGECMFFEFEFDLVGDTLLLEQIEYDYNDDYEQSYFYKAFKCPENCCNKEKELFQSLKVNIQLPIAADTTKLIAYDDYYFLKQNIFYGFPKKEYNGYGNVPVLSLGHNIALPSDIPIWDEKTKIKIREEMHSKIKVVFFADIMTTFDAMDESMRVYRKLGYNEIYFALRSPSVFKDFKIWLKPFDLSNLEKMDKSNDFRTVGEWLNLNSTTPN